MPESKQYMEIRLDDSTATALTVAMSATAVVTDVKVSGDALGSGGTVGGLATRKYRLTTDFKYTSTTGSKRTAAPPAPCTWWRSTGSRTPSRT
jgi:hypothetical protein